MRCASVVDLVQVASLALGLWTIGATAQSSSNNNGTSTKSQPLDIMLFHSLRRVGAPVVSPNQKNALFVTSYYNPEINKSTSYISCIDISTGNITQLTEDRPGTLVNNPIWFDDERFGFMRRGALYKQELKPDSSPDLLYNPPVAISNVAYRANSNLLAFMASVYPNASLTDSARSKRGEQSRFDSALVYDNLWARHWDEWTTVEKPNVFVIKLNHTEDGLWRLGDEINLTAKLPQCPDPRVRWCIDDYAISPSGEQIAFVTRPPTSNMTWSTNVDVFLVPTTGQSRPRLLTPRINGMASSPVFSSDGKRLAWLQMETPGYESDINRIYVHNIAARETTAIAYDWDLSPHSLAWSKDDKHLYATTSVKGRNLVIAIEVATGKREELTSTGAVGSVRPVDEKSMLLTHSAQDEPGDIHLLEVPSCKTKQLTHVNKELLKDVHLCPAEDFYFSGARSDKIHGWIVRPANFDRRKKYPMALLIHGGPQQAAVQAFSHAQWNPNMYANAGFATVVINFHGSAGYGQNFTDSIRHKWGDYPYVDLMRGIDYVTSKFSFVDASRMVALGGSYGGYMANWLNGHTDRFQALVAHDGKFNTISGYYGTDELWFPEWDLGKPWEIAGRAILEENNPERFAANFKTPTLFIQGEKDFRIPVTESLGAWAMLRRRNIPSRLVYFPDEGHWVNKPANSVRWYTEVLDWITAWTNTTAPYKIRQIEQQ
ncbi:dipeptidylpeptidase [Coemansia sp. RSA 1722]|nr:dipeptidylpeptidase [Coemansia sp. RSA 486]KAJ2233824.1 Dipeptidyl-peptidase 5 [Coemansia sp. RSA 485]KAJ2606316.1 dipeptidylpeptidase [Coemansia sp. RSA 1722]